MRLYSILVVFLLTSFLLLLPAIRPAAEVDLFPSQPKTVIVNIQSADVKLTSSSRGIRIDMNVSYLDVEALSLDNLTEYNTFFENSITLENLDSQGQYLFWFKSSTITTLTIEFVGVPPITLAVVSILLVIWGIFYILKRITTPEIY